MCFSLMGSRHLCSLKPHTQLGESEAKLACQEVKLQISQSNLTFFGAHLPCHLCPRYTLYHFIIITWLLMQVAPASTYIKGSPLKQLYNLFTILYNYLARWSILRKRQHEAKIYLKSNQYLIALILSTNFTGTNFVFPLMSNEKRNKCYLISAHLNLSPICTLHGTMTWLCPVSLMLFVTFYSYTDFQYT